MPETSIAQKTITNDLIILYIQWELIKLVNITALCYKTYGFLFLSQGELSLPTL